MTNTQLAVCALLRSALFGEAVSQPQDVNWADVCRELEEQAVLALPGDLIKGLNMPEPIRAAWQKQLRAQVYRGYQNAAEQNALAALLQEHGIAYVVLKGAAAAMYYPRPEYRSMGDIDVIVTPQDYEAAQRLLSENGFVQEEKKAGGRDEAYHRHGVLLELHRRFSYGEGERDAALEAMIIGGIERREMRRTSEGDFPGLPHRENGLVLLEHINQHLEGGLGLRQIVDWLMYVRRELHDDAWPAFRREAERLGLVELALTVTKMGQLYLGLPTEGIAWCRDADESLCADLLAYLFQSGDFGGKDMGSSTTVNALSRSQDGFFRNLQRSGCRNWKALEKHPWLKPFAWLYQLCRYARRGFARENPIRSLVSDYAKGRKLNRMLRRLGATRHGK